MGDLQKHTWQLLVSELGLLRPAERHILEQEHVDKKYLQTKIKDLKQDRRKHVMIFIAEALALLGCLFYMKYKGQIYPIFISVAAVLVVLLARMFLSSKYASVNKQISIFSVMLGFQENINPEPEA